MVEPLLYTHGPFWSVARAMAERRLAPLPLGGEEGKTPLLRGFNHWRIPPSVATIETWRRLHGHRNVGLVCGASGIVVVDLDDAELLGVAVDKLGASPLTVRTPGGGLHLYYRNDELIGSHNLRKWGVAADIKGVGGIIACPPSVHPVTRLSYTFETGDWSSVAALPILKCAALQEWLPGIFVPAASSRAGRNCVGIRNLRLFDHLRVVAPWSDFQSLLKEAYWYNRTQNAEPESDQKIEATARSVWNYQQRGTLLQPTQGYIRILHAVLESLKQHAQRDYPTVLAVYAHLLHAHGARTERSEPFALSPMALSQAQVVTGIKDRRRYERARDVLLALGLLEEIEPPRRQPDGLFSPGRYRLVQPSAVSTQNVA